MHNESQQTKKMKFHECKIEIKFLVITLVQFEESGATLEQLQFLEMVILETERQVYP